MHLIVGLGNPGKKYDGTRHNVGFAVVDALATSLDVGFKKGLGEYTIAISKSSGDGIVLVKPMTYMNLSGSAVGRVIKQYEIPVENLLVIVDDFQLSLGVIRIRKGGSAGGHNGLISIINHLDTDQYPRLRCGIAGAHLPGSSEAKAGYVLDRFNKKEQVIVDIMIEEAKDASLMIVKHGIDKAMSRFNSKQE